MCFPVGIIKKAGLIQDVFRDSAWEYCAVYEKKNRSERENRGDRGRRKSIISIDPTTGHRKSSLLCALSNHPTSQEVETLFGILNIMLDKSSCSLVYCHRFRNIYGRY